MNNTVFQNTLKSVKSGGARSAENALMAGAKSGLDIREITAIARSAASYAVKAGTA